jgi:cytochrome c oxidase subunit 3
MTTSNISTSSNKKDLKIHPQKFAMWLAIASIIMMFGGLTSGYLVRRSQGMWEVFDLPQIFIASTVAICLSSITIYVALKKYKQAQFGAFRILLLLTLLLGVAFSVMQLIGFNEMHQSNIKIAGNPSGSFLYIIAGIHILHIVGGVLTIAYQLIKTRKNIITEDNIVGLEIVNTYWHFVDILWLYLYIFFIFFR